MELELVNYPDPILYTLKSFQNFDKALPQLLIMHMTITLWLLNLQFYHLIRITTTHLKD